MRKDIYITVNRKDIIKAISGLKISLKSRKKSYAIDLECVIIVKKSFLELLLPGVYFKVPCYTKHIETNKALKIELPAIQFFQLIEDTRKDQIKIIIDNFFDVDGCAIPYYSYETHEDTIENNLTKLPYNFNFLDLLKYDSELENHNGLPYSIVEKILEARRAIERDINSVFKILSKYGYSKKDTKELLYKNINN